MTNFLRLMAVPGVLVLIGGVLDAQPSNVSVSPSPGSGTAQTFTFTASSPAGGGNITTVQMLFSWAVWGPDACFVQYNQSGNLLYLYNDDTSQALGGLTPGSAGTVSNSQCTLDSANSSVTISGNNLLVKLALSFKPAFIGPQQVDMVAYDSAGQNSSWQQVGSWTAYAASSTQTPTVTVTPTSGTGFSQTFTFTSTDQNGAAYMPMETLSLGPYSNPGCALIVYHYNNSAYLLNDAGAGIYIAPGGSASNSQCTINSISGSDSGNNWTYTVSATFSQGYAGALQPISAYVLDHAGQTNGWQQVGTWTVLGPGAVSVSPSSGSGTSQTFTFVYSDTSGASDLSAALALIDTSVTGSSSCYVWVTPSSGAVWLAADDASWPSPSTLGAAGTLQNSQCSLNVAASSATASGNTYTLHLALTFQNAYAGAKNVYSYAGSQGGTNSGWRQLGTWTAGASAPVSVSPSFGSGTSQTFTFVYSDTSGASDLSAALALIDTSVTGSSSCYVWVTPSIGAVWLAADDGSWPSPSTLGAAGTLQNSQCSLNVGASSATASGNTYTLHLALAFQSVYAGTKNVYSYAGSQSGTNSGWQQLGTWTVHVYTPQAVSVSPSSGSGTSQTFTFVYSDDNGAPDLYPALALINTSVTGSSSCYVWVTPSSGAVWLAADNGSWPSPGTLGTAGTLQNSQCSLNVGASSATTSGNAYTLHLVLTFQSAYVGAKNVYSYAGSLSGTNSGWQQVGTWTVPGPSTTSVSPASGSGPSQIYSFQFSDTSGASSLTSVSALIGASTAAASSCEVIYNPAQNTLALLTDSGGQPSATIAPGSSLLATFRRKNQFSAKAWLAIDECLPARDRKAPSG